MVLLCIEKKYPLDEVCFVDLGGADYQCIYDTWSKLCGILDEHGIKHTVLRPPHDFAYYLHSMPKKNGYKGYGFCGLQSRWGTGLKRDLSKKRSKEIGKPCVWYIGIASDELKRARPSQDWDLPRIYPLINMGMTESDCLIYCYRKGFLWEELDKNGNKIKLYDYISRVSCFACMNCALADIRLMINHLPQYWEKIKDMERISGQKWKVEGTEFYEEKIRKENEKSIVIRDGDSVSYISHSDDFQQSELF